MPYIDSLEARLPSFVCWNDSFGKQCLIARMLSGGWKRGVLFPILALPCWVTPGRALLPPISAYKVRVISSVSVE